MLYVLQRAHAGSERASLYSEIADPWLRAPPAAGLSY